MRYMAELTNRALVRMLKTRYVYREWVEKENIYVVVERSKNKRFEIHDEKIRLIQREKYPSPSKRL